MMEYKKAVPGDRSQLPGMHTIPADRSQRDKVSYLANVEYVQRDGKPLYLQLLLPGGLDRGVKSTLRYPLVVYVQGSAWGAQNIYVNLPQLVPLAKAGFVVASVQHRPSSEAQFPAFLQDVKSAIRFLRAHAEEYFIDPQQVGVWGDSSGGHAAQMVGVTGDLPQFKTQDNAQYSDSVQAAVDFYGPSDVTRINDGPRDPQFTADKTKIPEDILFGGCVIDHPEIAQPGNPLNYIEEGKPLPPFLIVHGDEDPMVPFNQSYLTAQKLQQTGHLVEFYKVLGAGHGTFLWTDRVLELVIQFFQAWLGV
ncbi:MAG: alpha/beta hydrolase fold domain-containing protein [Acutalibacter sp.]|jgi:acetyl esterase/lipase